MTMMMMVVLLMEDNDRQDVVLDVYVVVVGDEYNDAKG